MNILLLIIAVLVAIVILCLLIFKKQDKEKPVAYVCDQCGEVHCDCHRKEENESSRQ